MSMVDYMVWPWIERMDALKLYKNVTLDPERFPKFLYYIENMKKLPVIQQLMISPEHHVHFVKSYFSGQEPDYDGGL